MYLIPKNVGGRFEFIEGFGIKELIYCAVAAAVGLGISYLLGFVSDSRILKLIPVPGLTAIMFFIVRVEPRLGKSILSNFLDQKKYLSKPRRYYYIHGEGRKSLDKKNL